MHQRILGLAIGIPFLLDAPAQWRFEGDSTPAWEQVIERYAELDRTRSGAALVEIGTDDDGSPIHLFVLADGTSPSPDSIRAAGKNILWITNGIHPGEPDGIDASLLLARALLDGDQLMALLVHTAVCIVPVYNVSGAKDRNHSSRVNQNGPRGHGFRGNARHLDLNRDFIKADSWNTRSLVRALVRWDPDVYLETHVSNGADHRYVMELLTTHPDKLDTTLRRFMEERLVPRLYDRMERQGQLMGPYFETLHSIPEQGLLGFVDGPRYSTGYNALHQRIGVLTESHMLKPYADRVNATFQLMLGVLDCMNEFPAELKAARNQARATAREIRQHATNWSIDTGIVSNLPWKGYAVDTVPSEVSGAPRIRYDHARPTDGKVPWMGRAGAGLVLDRPVAYLIPQAWREVIERLELDNVELQRVQQERQFVVEVQRIAGFTSARGPYEGHYLHRDITTASEVDTVTARPGDVIVPMGQATDGFVIEVLEPRCLDSYFAWGFFDSVLQQKEWFSDYVFEDVAADLLQRDPELRAALEERRSEDPAFAASAWEQLYWVYQRSPYFEPGYRRYPVLRIIE